MPTGETAPVKKAKFKLLQPPPGVKPAAQAIDFLGDVPMELSMELGRTTLTVREVLDLQEGSLISLNRLAGDRLEVLVNGRPLATAEVVIINDTLGARIHALIDEE